MASGMAALDIDHETQLAIMNHFARLWEKDMIRTRKRAAKPRRMKKNPHKNTERLESMRKGCIEGHAHTTTTTTTTTMAPMVSN